MFHIYHPRSAFRRIARELGVSANFPNQNRTVRRGKQTKRNVNIGIASLQFTDDTLNANISNGISKVETFRCLDTVDVRHPPLFATMEDAMQWKHGYLARRDRLFGGRGITIVEKGQSTNAKFDFLVGIVPVQAEYRIHVGRLDANQPYQIIATQQKVGVRDCESLIHNHDAGVTFSLQPLRMSPRGQARAEEMAKLACQSTGLDFGAVDLMQGRDGRLYILEINTAPGIRTESLYACYLEFFGGLL